MLRAWTAAMTVLLLSGAMSAATQGATKPHVIGYLGSVSPSKSPALAPLWHIFIESLREHDYDSGRNLVIEARFGEGDVKRYASLAEELVDREVELIVARADEVIE